MAGTDEGIRTRDLNKATVRDIANLPFMNEQRARLIVAYRDSRGPFRHVDDVDNVTGIGQRLTELVKQHFHVEGEEREEVTADEAGRSQGKRR